MISLYHKQELTGVEMDKQTMKQMLVRIPTEVHNSVKSAAALANISLRKYVIRALLEKLKREE